MIRPAWRSTQRQQRLLDQAVATAKAADAADEKAWEAIRKARDAGVPDTILCEQTGRSRATLNRRFGNRQSDGAPSVPPHKEQRPTE